MNFNIAQTVTPTYILDMGGTALYSGLQSTLFYLTAVVLRFFFGPLADRKGNRIALFIGALAFMLSPLLFLLHQSVPYILLVRMFQAIGLAAYFSSASALVSLLAPAEKLGTFIGIYRMVTMSTLLMGPTLAFQVIAKYQYQAYHIMGVLIGLVAMLILHFVQEPAHPRPVNNAPLQSSTSMLRLLQQKDLRFLYLIILLVAFLFGLIQTFSLIYVKKYLTDVNPGLFFTLFGIGSLVSNLAAGFFSDRKGRAAVVFPGLIIMGVGMVGLAFLPFAKVLFYSASIVVGLGYAGAISVLITWVIDTAPKERRTSAIALQDSAMDLGIGLGSLVFGLLLPLLELPLSYGLSGVVLLVFGLGQMWNRKGK